MQYLISFILISLFIFPSNTEPRDPDSNTNEDSVEYHCITAEELKLYRQINDYRKKKGLPSIPLSASLTHVAKTHAIEMADELKTLTHGWVDCRYKSSNTKTYPCMWDKPRQLTVYEGNGYECAHGGNAHICTAEDALSGWQSSAPHNDVIINKGIWKTNKWNAIGIGIYEGYATIWFGNDVDPAGEPRVCK